MTRICTICARGGSKGVKGKNVRLIGGLPLIAHSLVQARQSELFDTIAVSSDSDEILRIAAEHGADHVIKRPDALATDAAAKLPVIRHCVDEVERRTRQSFDTMVDLDATSPLRNILDIGGVLKLLDSSGAGNVITAMPSRRSPYFNLVEVDALGIVRLSKPGATFVRRQDAPACFDMNASIYAWRRTAFFERSSLFNDDTRLFVMPEERSIDIDSELDFQFVEFLMTQTAGDKHHE
jgi:N-acylneuraminate cytidylyltransferase/CMP-N,N'-diacetyllegionaminic acid synthase